MNEFNKYIRRKFVGAKLLISWQPETPQWLFSVSPVCDIEASVKVFNLSPIWYPKQEKCPFAWSNMSMIHIFMFWIERWNVNKHVFIDALLSSGYSISFQQMALSTPIVKRCETFRMQWLFIRSLCSMLAYSSVPAGALYCRSEPRTK